MNNLTEQKKRWIRRVEKEKEFCTLLFSGDMRDALDAGRFASYKGEKLYGMSQMEKKKE